MVYGYYSYAGRLHDEGISSYWTLPGGFGSAPCDDGALFPGNFAYLQGRFPWLVMREVMTDAGVC